MAYSRIPWADRNVQYPNRYTDELANVKTFTPSPGTITEPGTFVNAARMNIIQDGIDQNNLFNMLLSTGKYKVTDFDKTITSRVTNGNFTSGATGWVGQFAVATETGNNLILTGAGTNALPHLYHITSGTVTLNDRLNLQLKVRVTNSNCLRIRIGYSTGGPVTIIHTETAPTINTWYPISKVFDIVSIVTSTLYLYIYHDYVDAATANAKALQIEGLTNGVRLIKMNGEYFEDYTDLQMQSKFPTYFTSLVYGVFEQLKLTSDDSVYATLTTEFGVPTPDDVTTTLTCNELGLLNKTVVEFDVPTLGDIKETTSAL